VHALGEIVCGADVIDAVHEEEQVGTPARRKVKRTAFRLALLAQGKISSSEILVRSDALTRRQRLDAAGHYINPGPT
jgi:hypothetical protein